LLRPATSGGRLPLVFSFLYPLSTILNPLFIYTAKLQKISETTKHFERNFQNISSARHEVTLCLQRIIFANNSCHIIQCQALVTANGEALVVVLPRGEK